MDGFYLKMYKIIFLYHFFSFLNLLFITNLYNEYIDTNKNVNICNKLIVYDTS